MTTPGLPGLPPDEELVAGQPVKAAHLRAFKDYVDAVADQALAPSDAVADAAINRAEAAGRLLSPENADVIFGTGARTVPRPRPVELVPFAVFGAEQSPAWAFATPNGGTVETDVADPDFIRAGRLTTTGGNTGGGIGPRVIIGLAFDPPIDITGLAFVVPLKIDRPDKSHSVRLTVQSGAGNLRQIALFPQGVTPNEVFTYVFRPTDVAQQEGVTDLTAITNINVEAYDNNTGTPIVVTLGGLQSRPLKPGPDMGGVVSLTFDDSSADHFTVARPYLSRYGWQGTLFPILGAFGSPGSLTQSQVDQLAYVYGWEIAAHATTSAAHTLGLPGMTQAQRLAELTALRAYAVERGYSSDTFAYPLGAIDTASANDVRKFFSIARINAAGDPFQDQSPVVPMAVNSVNVDGLTTQQVKDKISVTATAGGWLPLTFHGLSDLTKFTDILTHLRASGVSVRTMQDVLSSVA